MSRSQTQICNQAIGKLGGTPIIDIDQDSTEAKLCKSFYDDVLQTLLEEHPWTFATKRYELPQSAETPPKPFAVQYLIPPNVLRIINASANPNFSKNNTTQWQVENGFILSNDGTMFIRAIINETDLDKFTPSFIRVFVVRLAAEISLALTQSSSMHTQLMQEFGILFERAVSSDSQQGTSRRYRSDQLILVRTAGTSFAGPYTP
jgi:hypothetical protein